MTTTTKRGSNWTYENHYIFLVSIIDIDLCTISALWNPLSTKTHKWSLWFPRLLFKTKLCAMNSNMPWAMNKRVTSKNKNWSLNHFDANPKIFCSYLNIYIIIFQILSNVFPRRVFDVCSRIMENYYSFKYIIFYTLKYMNLLFSWNKFSWEIIWTINQLFLFYFILLL